jgi:hypothetical protein
MSVIARVEQASALDDERLLSVGFHKSSDIISANRRSVTEGHAIDTENAIIIVLGLDRYLPEYAMRANCFFVWPGERTAYAIGNEIHFVLYNYVYIVPRGGIQKSTAGPKRQISDAKGYKVPRDLLIMYDKTTSAEAILMGEEMHIDDYKAKFPDDVWIPTNQEYRDWVTRVRGRLKYPIVLM